MTQTTADGSAEAIGIDAGGTKIAVFRVSGSGQVLAHEEVHTPADDAEETISAMVETARHLLTPEVRAVGIGAAGMVEAATGVLRFAPNIAWRNVPLAERISRELDLPCQVDNDANVAAWGEFRFGAGRNHRHMLLVTVGTGIGGGIVSDGKLFRGAHGFAAEIGHIIVEPDGPECGCGNHGCWEQVAAGRAIGRLAREEVERDPSSPFAELFGGDHGKADGEAVTAAAKGGDSVARGILRRVAVRLGEGIAGLVNILDPDIVVVGGGAIEAGELLLDPARERFAETVEAVGYRPDVPIVAAELGNRAGAIGAAKLALEELVG